MNAILNFASRILPGLGRDEDVHAFNGGVHPPEHKSESSTQPISVLNLPKTLVLPLRQHVGHLPKLQVKVGDRVLKGQLLAEAEGTVSAAIHAPTSGTITAIDEQIIPHPSGLPDTCITLSSDGLDTWAPLQPIDWQASDKKTLVDSLRRSGIVGLGGATFPSHIKLRSNSQSPIHTLIINAAECEPYITCDDMLMRERADAIVSGIEIVKYLLGAEKCLIGIEDNKPLASKAMRAACSQGQAEVKVVPTLYPSGDARRLIHLLLDLEIPSDKRSTDLGVQVFNVATVLAIHRYFAFGEPSISRIVTITGNVLQPQNFEVLFGTPLNDLIQAAGGAHTNTSHYIMGGPMMGFDLPNSQVPITKASNCIIAARQDLFPAAPPAMPCIRCTRCADACPVNLQPQELYWFAKSDNFEKARDYKLFDCIECGCCSYVCPSTIPLVQYYRYAKSEIIATDKAKEAADLARERNEFRLARIEREKLERAQKHAERAAGGRAEASANTDATVPSTPTASDSNDKQAAIAAAIARAKAQKLAGGSPAPAQTSPTAAADNTDKQALIAAAIERAKAAKLAAAQAGEAPKNTENVSPSVQAEIKQTDALREKVKKSSGENADIGSETSADKG
ncbi:MAG: electron transport complex subunit RsxC [Methylotenera sp.]|nr:electron transport complex subunit RsxC [Methylotenera sp.]